MFDLRPYRKSGLQSYNPFREMEELERQFFAPFFYAGDLAEFKTDITDQGESFLLEADLPGFDKKDISLDLAGDTLTIHAQRHSDCEKKDCHGKVLCQERSYGQYSRSFDVSGVEADKIKAQYENGVLKLNLPKKQVPQPETRRLAID